MNVQHQFLLAGALYGASGVALGAWGAHGLAAFLGTTTTGAWDTAVLYQMMHALCLLFIGGALSVLGHSQLLSWAGYLVTLGVLLFSGSIYALVLGAPGWLGPVTPVGGVCFIVAWSLLALAAWRWTPR